MLNDQTPQPVVEGGRSCDEEQKAPIPVAVEDIAGDQQQTVLEFRPLPKGPVADVHRAKEQEESQAIE